MTAHPYWHWIALKQTPGIGTILYKRLIGALKTPEAVFAAPSSTLLAIEGLSREAVSAIQSFKDNPAVDQEIEKLERSGAKLICLNDPGYPPLLSAIYDPPPLLYVKGDMESATAHPIAVVGTRKCTAYGRSVTEHLCRDLSRQGATLVSGFARGIDGIAHKTALASGGKTLAVLGCGIDIVYPPEHKKLYEAIPAQGAVISEFPMGTPPEPHHFPQRNRIISGLSLGCVVIEAALKSGSLITARLALEQGREVFAVPGSIFSPMSAGTHQLLLSGAKLIRDVEDILEEILPLRTKSHQDNVTSAPPSSLEGEALLIYQQISYEPRHTDQVIEETALPTSAVLNLLLILELQGLIRKMEGQFYVRT